MDVSPELNSLLPDEIMDTEAGEDVPQPQCDSAAIQSEPSNDTLVPMETDAPAASDNSSQDAGSSAEQNPAPSAPADPKLGSGCGVQLPVVISVAPSPILALKSPMATSTAATRTTDSVTGTSVTTSGLQKLTAPFTISPANHQIILNKVASAQATEAAKAVVNQPQVLKPEGQKLLVTTIGKPGQPIVLQLPHAGTKPGVVPISGDGKLQAQQFKVVTIGGRTELKPVVGSASNQVTTLQAQQLKTLQVIVDTEFVTADFLFCCWKKKVSGITHMEFSFLFFSYLHVECFNTGNYLPHFCLDTHLLL